MTRNLRESIVFTHMTVGANDLTAARAFYDAVLLPLGYKRLFE